MRAAVLTSPGRVEVTERDEPKPEQGQTLVALRAAGICGTDVKIIQGAVRARLPVVVGHELIGEVVQPADGSPLAAGTRVVADPSSSCGRCRVCRQDLPHLCPHGGLMGRDSDGVFADLVAIPDSRLHPLPAGMALEDAVLLQVLATCVHAQSRVTPRLGQTAVVTGLGTSGLLHVSLLRAAGIATIVAVSRSAAKRALAARLGASTVAAPADALAFIGEVTDGAGVDLAIDCGGHEKTLRQAMDAAGAGGTVLVFGTVTPAADGMPTYDWYRKELTLVNTRAARPRDFTAAISVVASGQVRPRDLITARYPLAAVRRAVGATGHADQVKVMLTP